MIAWLAPGQGMERPGMGRGLSERWPEVAPLLRGFTGSGASLTGTENVQPALTALSVATAQVLRQAGCVPDVVAGHSVGEIAAWCIAGGCTAEQAIEVARARGHAMAREARGHPGGMWVLPEGQPATSHVVAVHNPGRLVVAGPEPGPVEGVAIPGAGAWHTQRMAGAIPELRRALRDLPSRALVHPMVSNHDGMATSDDGVIREHLVRQLTAPVRWSHVLSTLAELEVTDVVLLGPGKILASHLRRALPAVRVHRTDRISDLVLAASTDGWPR